MISSDWGDWLPRAVADANPDGVALWYLGCNGFIVKGNAGTTIFIDPYLGTGDPPRTIRMVPVPFDPADVTSADAVFSTHEHTDHVHGPSQAPILANTGARYYAPDASVEKALDEEDWQGTFGVGRDQVNEVAVGDTLDVGEFTVTVETAHDEDAVTPVSYVFEHDAGTFIHAGDSKPGPELSRIGKTYDLDLGILAFGSVGMIADKQTQEPTRTKWYSDETEVVDAASALRLDRLLPSHWDMWKGLTADPNALHSHARSYAFPKRLDIVEIGDRVDL